jgi:DNA-binding transcriptional LysR family regulator
LLGLGVAVASAWAMADDVAHGRLLHLAPEWTAEPLPMYVVYPYAPFYPAKLRRFTEVLRAALVQEMVLSGMGGG